MGEEPWAILGFWEGKEIPKPPTLDERREMMMRQLQDLVRLKGEYVAVREMRKVCGWYVKGLPGSAEFRRTVNSITDIDELKKLIIG